MIFLCVSFALLCTALANPVRDGINQKLNYCANFTQLGQEDPCKTVSGSHSMLDECTGTDLSESMKKFVANFETVLKTAVGDPELCDKQLHVKIESELCYDPNNQIYCDECVPKPARDDPDLVRKSQNDSSEDE